MFKIVHDVFSVVILRVLADRHHSLEKRGSERTSLVAYYVETTECRVAYRDCRAQSRKKYSRKEKTGQQLLRKGVGWFTIKPSVTIVALDGRRYSYHRCVECGKKGLRDAEGKYGCVEHPEAETKQTYRLRVLLRQGDLNMWVTAFDKVAESILGISVKKFSALDDDGRKRVAWGVSGMKCYMTVEKTQGKYTNYTIESMKRARYLY